MDKLVAFFAVHKVRQTLRPSILELNEDFNQFYIILKLRIHYLDVLFVLL